MPYANFLPTNTHTTWGQLHGASLSLALALFCNDTAGVKLLVTPNSMTALQLSDEIKFFLGDDNPQPIRVFPDWEILPYDHFSPHQDIISERLLTLNQLLQSPDSCIVIAAVNTIMHRLCPSAFLTQYALTLKQGQTLLLEPFRQQLVHAGYRCVNQVLEHGEFAVRGGLLDLFPMGSAWPYRLEWFDDSLESLRRFDPETQRTVEKVNQINILPAREFPINSDGSAQFRQAFREQFSVNLNQCPVYTAISQDQLPNGIEYYLPLFFTHTATIFDYLPKNSRVCLIDNIKTHADAFYHDVTARHAERCHDTSRPILNPSQCFLSADEFLNQVNQHQPLRLQQLPLEKKSHAINLNTATSPALPIERQGPLPFIQLKHYLEHNNNRVVILVESAGRREVLLSLLQQSHLYPKIQPNWTSCINDNAPLSIVVGPINDGVELPSLQLTLLVEAQFFGQQRTPQQQRRTKTINPDLIFRDLAELRVGDPVVHLDFGVGRYQGLQSIADDGIINEFLTLVYAGEDKIYVPVTSLHCISRYTGADSEHAPLHRLGTDQWQKEKKKAAEKINDVAVELLALYAQRAAMQGFVYRCEPEDYLRFANAFPFEETPDQLHAIDQIINDMQSTKPMDRLICGDVGFGKTEVAMRASFIAVQNGKQVCVLVPTTLLAGQHFETFKDRFAEFPFNIELLSRFRSSKDSLRVIEGIQNGKVDIVIGTHKLLQKDLAFKQLGLLIIDEEHRFGVKQKEHINALRAHLDILSMTATPIPRTLNMAMAGIRDISLITTPPAKRLAIKTFWQEKQPTILREAILREIHRGGQVFFLHNNVQTIDRICQELQQLIPEAAIQSAHGQLRERDLERIMSDFYHHRFNVLVCTTIIETGIDIPTANTIIIDRADQLGLAQLHQLRGRVGRSHHQAYAYLLTPPEKQLTADAKKRLDAIVSLEDLGAGFTLASHDLEIRGAGDFLGEEQSGNMHAIGFHLFMEMLERAVADLKAGRIPDLSNPIQQGPEVNLYTSAIIPDDYIPDVHVRLIFYKRIANAETDEQLRELQVELIDRFGLMPEPLKRLFLINTLKRTAETLGIKRINANTEQGRLEFAENPKINAHALIRLIQTQSARYQMHGPQQLKFKLDKPEPEARIAAIKALLLELTP